MWLLRVGLGFGICWFSWVLFTCGAGIIQIFWVLGLGFALFWLLVRVFAFIDLASGVGACVFGWT